MSDTATATTMSAVVQHAYGTSDALRVETVPVPVAGPTDVVVAVRAAGVDAGTWHLMTGRPYLMRLIGFGVRGPKARVRGLAFAGRVSAVGADVTDLRPGDDVFGSADGAFAEFVRAPRSALVRLPASIGYEQAAAVPVSAVTALQALRAAAVPAGGSVLVLGASGGVGHYAVQLAVAAGATVTGVCSTAKAEFVRGLGAAEVIDYRATDVTATGRRWDAIIDTAGDRRLSRLRIILAPSGSLVIVGGMGGPVLGGMERVLAAAVANRFVRQRLIGLVSKENASDLAELADLVDAGAVTPMVDAVLPLDRAGEAIDLVASGAVRGKVVVVP